MRRRQSQELTWNCPTWARELQDINLSLRSPWLSRSSPLTWWKFISWWLWWDDFSRNGSLLPLIWLTRLYGIKRMHITRRSMVYLKLLVCLPCFGFDKLGGGGCFPLLWKYSNKLIFINEFDRKIFAVTEKLQHLQCSLYKFFVQNTSRVFKS